jgi:hypothetical protein
MAQFPLALAIEPRFLPLAVANGFRMDSSVRNLHHAVAADTLLTVKAHAVP